MKLIFNLFLILVGVIAVYSAEEISSLERIHSSDDASVHILFKLIRDLIMNGSIEDGVPVLDPYKFESISIKFSGLIYSIEANITNGVISGLSNFDLNKYDFDDNEISLDLNISFPLLTFSAEHYEMDGNIWGWIPLAGRGILYLEAHYTTLWGKIYFKQSENGKSILIDKIQDPQFNIGHFTSRTQFDNNIDDIFNAIIDELFAYYVNRFNKYLASICVEAAVETLNSVLENIDIWRNMVTIL